MSVEYDDGVPDNELTRKHKPAESFTTRRGRARGFYYGEVKIPVGYMKIGEMQAMSDFLESL